LFTSCLLLLDGIAVAVSAPVDDQSLDSTRYDKDKAPEAGRKSDPKTGGGYTDTSTRPRTRRSSR
jgi:hypothetical protein